MFEAVVRVALPCSWVAELTREHAAVVTILEQKALGDGLLRTLAEIDPVGAEPRAIADALRQSRYVTDLEAVIPPKGKILATFTVRGCHGCSVLANSACFLTDATAADGGGVEWRLLAPKREAVEALVQEVEARGLDVTLVALRSATGGGTLTDRQDQVLSLAHKLGYFEFPKRINLSDLAERLGVAKSTLSEILRTGEEKILHEYFQRVARQRA